MNFEMFWLIAFAVLLVLEIATAALVSIWFCIGALFALIAAILGFGPITQCIVFILASLIILIFTRPVASKLLKGKIIPTNIDKIVGLYAVVTEDIDNLKETGAVSADGKIWTARSCGDIIKKGENVVVKEVKGVKLIVSLPKKEESSCHL